MGEKKEGCKRMNQSERRANYAHLIKLLARSVSPIYLPLVSSRPQLQPLHAQRPGQISSHRPPKSLVDYPSSPNFASLPPFSLRSCGTQAPELLQLVYFHSYNFPSYFAFPSAMMRDFRGGFGASDASDQRIGS